MEVQSASEIGRYGTVNATHNVCKDRFVVNTKTKSDIKWITNVIDWFEVLHRVRVQIPAQE